MEKINILVIPSDNRGGVGFYRSTQPHIQLQEQYPDDFSVTFNMQPNWSDLVYFEQFQIVHVHKGMYNDMVGFYKALEHFKKKGIVTIMDIDDHWKLSSAHPQFYLNKNYHVDDIIKMNLPKFDYITTTTDIFRNEILPFNKNVKVFPNSINPEDKNFQINKKESDRLRIGMVMGSTHEKDMELIGKISKQLTKEELDKVQFVLCGYDLRGTITMFDPKTKETKKRPIKPEESVWYRYEKMMTCDYEIVSPEYKKYLLEFNDKVEYENVDNEPYRRCWTKPMNEYYQHYNNVDILLAPLAINDFNKVKSPLKVAECVFSNTGIIASEYGPYTIDLKNMFEKGGTINENGNALLIPENKNKKHWLRFIKMLIKDRELVKKMKENLHKDLCEKYDLRNVTKDRAEFYKTCVEMFKNK